MEHCVPVGFCFLRFCLVRSLLWGLCIIAKPRQIARWVRFRCELVGWPSVALAFEGEPTEDRTRHGWGFVARGCGGQRWVCSERYRVGGRSCSVESNGACHRPRRMGALDVRWGGMRWWFLPLFVASVGMWAAWVLWQTSQMTDSAYGMVILDAPLPSALRSQPWFAQDRRYFVLQPQTDPAQVVISQPGRGVRAYRGQEGVPLFGAQTPLTELFLPPCSVPPEADATYFYTGDGMILWACLQDHERIGLYRVGWRFSEASWRKGRSLGYSANNDIVMGGAMLPLQSARLRLQGHEMHIRPQGTCLSLPQGADLSEDIPIPQETPPQADPQNKEEKKPLALQLSAKAEPLRTEKSLEPRQSAKIDSSRSKSEKTLRSLRPRGRRFAIQVHNGSRQVRCFGCTVRVFRIVR